MTNLVLFIHALSGLIVLAEAHRRFEAAQLTCASLTRRQRALQALHVVGWLLLAFPAVAAIFAPIISVAGPPICWNSPVDVLAPPGAADVLVMAGFAVMIVRGWLDRP